MEVCSVGFDASIFVIKPLEHFDCALCLKILNDPRQCPNGHCFCFGCISTVLTKRNTCPICKEDLDLVKLTKNLVVSAVIGDMNVYCTSRVSDDQIIPDGSCNDYCQWTGPLHYRRTHYETECGFYIVKCEFVGCDQQLQRQHMSEHSERCLFRRVPCDYCNDTRVYLSKNLETHKLRCEFRPTSCSNRCSGVVPFNQLDQHLRLDCPLQLVDCPLKALLGVCRGDCPGMITRESVESHVIGPDSLFSTVMRVVEPLSGLKRDQLKLRTGQTDLTSRMVDISTKANDSTEKLTDIQTQLGPVADRMDSALSTSEALRVTVSGMEREVQNLTDTVNSLVASDKQRLEKISSLEQTATAANNLNAALTSRVKTLDTAVSSLQNETRRLGGVAAMHAKKAEASTKQCAALSETVDEIRQQQSGQVATPSERAVSSLSAREWVFNQGTKTTPLSPSVVKQKNSEDAACTRPSAISVTDASSGGTAVKVSTVSPSSVVDTEGFGAFATRESAPAVSVSSASSAKKRDLSGPSADTTERALSAFSQHLKLLHSACRENSFDNPNIVVHQNALRLALLTNSGHSSHLLQMLLTEPTVGLAHVVFGGGPGVKSGRSAGDNAAMMVTTYTKFAQEIVSGTKNALWIVDDMCGKCEALRYLKGLLKFRLPDCELVENDYQAARKAVVKISGLTSFREALNGTYTYHEMPRFAFAGSYRRKGEWCGDQATFEIRKWPSGPESDCEYKWFITLIASDEEFGKLELFMSPCRKLDLFPPSQGWRCVDPSCGGCPQPTVKVVRGGE